MDLEGELQVGIAHRLTQLSAEVLASRRRRRHAILACTCQLVHAEHARHLMTRRERKIGATVSRGRAGQTAPEQLLLLLVGQVRIGAHVRIGAERRRRKAWIEGQVVGRRRRECWIEGVGHGGHWCRCGGRCGQESGGGECRRGGGCGSRGRRCVVGDLLLLELGDEMLGRMEVLACFARALALDEVDAHDHQVVLVVERTVGRRMGERALARRLLARAALKLGAYLDDLCCCCCCCVSCHFVLFLVYYLGIRVN